MSNLIKNLVNAARRFSGMDFAIFKVCLLTIGILLGAYFSDFFTKYILEVWIIAIAAWIILMGQIVRHYKSRNKKKQ